MGMVSQPETSTGRASASPCSTCSLCSYATWSGQYCFAARKPAMDTCEQKKTHSLVCAQYTKTLLSTRSRDHLGFAVH